MLAIAAVAASLTAPCELASTAVSSETASRSPRAPIRAMAASLSASGLSETSTDAARACSNSALTLGVGLGGDGRVERLDVGGIGRLEHGVGGGDADGRILGPQRQRAQRIADDAAQRVVDLDLGDVGLGGLAGFLAAQRVEQL